MPLRKSATSSRDHRDRDDPRDGTRRCHPHFGGAEFDRDLRRNGNLCGGGEFPIPNGLSCDTTRSPPLCQPQITFKKFGVSLVFTPVVLSEGRISLKVMTEVSNLSTENAMTLQVTGTRRADTTVEIPSGGSLALAGMLARISPAKGQGMVKERYLNRCNLAALALRDLRALTPASSRSSDKR